MAISLILMFGRFGGALSSIFTGALIYSYCNTMFGIYLVLMGAAAFLTYFILKKVEVVRAM